MTVLKFGIIGAGNSANNITTALKLVPNAKLIAIAARNFEHTHKIAQEHEIPNTHCFIDYHEMLKIADLDVVIISLPHNLHYNATLDALNAGKHVLCEKPLAINLTQGKEMIAKAQKKHLILGTIFQYRFFDASQKAKEMIDSGQLGQLMHAQVNVLWSRDQDYYDKSPWRGKWATEGGGSLINQASHSIDLMIWLVGKPKTVFGVFGAKTHKIEVDDNAAAVVQFENGVYATIQTSTSLKPGYPSKINIFGTLGMISVDGNSLKYINKDGKEINQDFEKKVDSQNDPKLVSYDALSRQIKDYVDAVQNKRSPLVDGSEGLRAIEVITAIYASAGQKVIQL